jgi:hypothetical protein
MGERTDRGGYEAAPGTELVDQRCVACGRALLDAESLAAGMGPDCREKYGVQATITAEERAEANRAIYLLASQDHGGTEAPVLIQRLRAIGFTQLCDRIEQRLVKAEIFVMPKPGAYLRVKAPVLPAWVREAQRILGCTRREEQYEGKPVLVDYVPNRPVQIQALHVALARCFAGKLARSPKGLFVVRTEDEVRAAFAKEQVAA